VAILKTQPGRRQQGFGNSEKESAFVKLLTVSDQITKAEALKAMQVASFGYSNCSSDCISLIGELFTAMLHGSYADQFTMSK